MRFCSEARLPLPHDRLPPQTVDQGSVEGESTTGSSVCPLGRLVPRRETGLRAYILDRGQPLGELPADRSLPQHPLTRPYCSLARGHRVCGKPRSTWLVAGSGQREVTTFPRV